MQEIQIITTDKFEKWLRSIVFVVVEKSLYAFKD